eukprot:4373968-Alexandrium_andersonii.AAC.1
MRAVAAYIELRARKSVTLRHFGVGCIVGPEWLPERNRNRRAMRGRSSGAQRQTQPGRQNA